MSGIERYFRDYGYLHERLGNALSYLKDPREFFWKQKAKKEAAVLIQDPELAALQREAKEFFPEGIYLHIQNGRRHCDVEVGTGIHINCWRNERYGRDDDLCSWSYNPPKDDQVTELSRYLQEVHFPLLEQPERRSDELFPAIWE